MPPPLGILLRLPMGHCLTHHGFMIEPQRRQAIVNIRPETIRRRRHCGQTMLIRKSRLLRVMGPS
jgi:hypothetical protein